MSTNRKLTRRKRKMHHGPSSLLRATIQEYGIYDRQVDAFKAQFIDSFDFLQNYSKNGKPHNEKATIEHSLQTCATPFLESEDLSRDISLEEELQGRLGRMTSIASSLRYLCNKEREEKQCLYNQCVECRNQCIVFISDMVEHFHRETGLLQQRLLELDGIIDELEHDRSRVKRAYSQLMEQATRTVEAMDADIQVLEKREIYQRSELERLRTDNATTKEKSAKQDEEIIRLKQEVEDVTNKLVRSESQNKSSDMASSQLEMLLDMALTKLRMYEEGTLPILANNSMKHDNKLSIETLSTSSAAGFVTLSSQPQTPTTESPFTPRHMTEFKLDYRKKRINSDSLSMISFETASEISLPIDAHRVHSEDRISITSLHSHRNSGQKSTSPKASKSRSKWKPFFTRAIIRKSPSTESHLFSLSKSTERLPTIKDERRIDSYTLPTKTLSPSLKDLKSKKNEKEGGLSRSRSEESCLSIKHLSLDRTKSYEYLDQTDNPNLESNGNTACSFKPLSLHEDKTHKLTNCVQCKNDQLDYPQLPTPNTAQKLLSKVKRTSSFAALRPRKNGLVALAKDIEKKFRKKRRSKTADFSQLVQVNTSNTGTEDTHTTLGGHNLCKADSHNNISSDPDQSNESF